METTTQKIPDCLIYEMVNDIPVYYQGYKDYISGNKKLDEIMGSSYIQGVIATELVIMLGKLIDTDNYRIISNEIGLRFEKNSWRAADIAIYKKSVLKGIPLNNKYLEVAPQVVIEIDTKANIEEASSPFGYYHEKTEQLLAFGVAKVIWIFTDSKRVLMTEKSNNWQIFKWSDDIDVFDDISFNIEQLIADYKG